MSLCQPQCSALKVHVIISSPLTCCVFNFHTGPPGPVNNLQVTRRTATTLTITWTVSGSIDRFEVTYSYTINQCSAPQGAPQQGAVTISDGSMRLHTLISLNEDSMYMISVRAINIAASTMATTIAVTETSGKPDNTFR